jgi:hypothetical protein
MERTEPDPGAVSADNPNFEHRQNRRVALFQEVVCEGDGVTARSEMADISVGGMFIDVARPPFPPGDLVTVRIALGPEEPRIVVPAEVHYVQDGIGMGIRFLDLPEVERERIRAFVEQIANRKIPKGERPMRKSSRVSISVPIRVRATHPGGGDFDEDTSIITLSKHGACILTRNPVDVGMKLFLETASGLEFKSSVVWVGDAASRSDGQVGLQCRGLAQALGFQFP